MCAASWNRSDFTCMCCYDSSDGGGARLAEGLDMGQMFNHLDLP